MGPTILCYVNEWYMKWMLFFPFETGFLHRNSPGYPGTRFVDQAGLKLREILLPLSPECWDQRHALLLPNKMDILIFINVYLIFTCMFAHMSIHMYGVYFYTWVHVPCTTHILGVIPYIPSTFISEAGSLLALKFADSVRLADQWSPIHLSPPPQHRDYKHTLLQPILLCGSWG